MGGGLTGEGREARARERLRGTGGLRERARIRNHQNPRISARSATPHGPCPRARNKRGVRPVTSRTAFRGAPPSDQVARGGCEEQKTGDLFRCHACQLVEMRGILFMGQCEGRGAVAGEGPPRPGRGRWPRRRQRRRCEASQGPSLRVRFLKSFSSQKSTAFLESQPVDFPGATFGSLRTRSRGSYNF